MCGARLVIGQVDARRRGLGLLHMTHTMRHPVRKMAVPTPTITSFQATRLSAGTRFDTSVAVMADTTVTPSIRAPRNAAVSAAQVPTEKSRPAASTTNNL